MYDAKTITIMTTGIILLLLYLSGCIIAAKIVYDRKHTKSYLKLSYTHALLSWMLVFDEFLDEHKNDL